MRKIKQDTLIVNVLLGLTVAITTIFLFKAPFDQIERANPETMNQTMNGMVKEIELLKEQHRKLPSQKAWQKAISPYVYHADYNVYVFNKKQKGIYYANMQEQYPMLLKNPLTNAIVKEMPPFDSIQMISYEENNQVRYGFYIYIDQWETYVALTGTNGYFESPKSLLWKSIFIEMILILFVIGMSKEIMRKHYVKPLERIVTALEKEYDFEKIEGDGTSEYETIAEQIEAIIGNHVHKKDGAS